MSTQTITPPAMFGALAWFPNRRLRDEFLEQIRLWNRIEGMPEVDAEPDTDGLRVRLSSRSYAEHGLRRLIDSYGGWIPPRRAATGWNLA